MPQNGRRRSKALQKNVSVYLGSRGGWQHEVLTEICRQFNLTESEFFRELFLQRLARWNLYDTATQEPLADAIEKFKRRRAVVSLPESLDHEEEDSHEWQPAKGNRRRTKGAI
jgi:hypothetical protein